MQALVDLQHRPGNAGRLLHKSARLLVLAVGQGLQDRGQAGRRLSAF